ncbi:MAG: N-6 DNA methylase [Candidatus Obscuribacterales bacterium]|nr:N-6 DNA methylase [Candidatus Obscuribacterales bacterium]
MGTYYRIYRQTYAHMTGSVKRKNSPLAYLRQIVSTLPVNSDNSSLVLYLSALTFLHRNNRLKHLAKVPVKFSSSGLRQLVEVLHDQLNAFSVTTASLEFAHADDEVWTTIWQKLQTKQLDNLWLDETTLGYVHQFLCLPQRSLSIDRLSQSDKTIDTQTLVAFTQLYTPHWVADFLLESTILPQWREKIPAEKLTVMDPACGAGNFLLKAFDLLNRLYLEEGATEKEACKKILEKNLHGVDIDERSLSVTALALLTKVLKTGAVESLQIKNLQAAIKTDPTENILGSLNRHWSEDHLLAGRYRVVVANPPYIGRKLMDRSLKHALKVNYPNSHNDLAGAFLERSIELAEPDGMVGLITQSSIISLPSYTKLRNALLEKTSIDTCVELGPGVFPLQGGEKINSLLLILANKPFKTGSKIMSRFIDLTSSKDKEVDLAQVDTAKAYSVSQETLKQNTNFVFNYRCPEIVSHLLKGALPLADIADVRQGLATTDNERFLRYWWDVDANEIGQRWFPYAKGAGVKRWHNPIKYVVNWQNDGQEIKEAVTQAYPYLNGNSAWVVKNEQYYFRQGLTFSFIGGHDFSVRYLPAGCIFDVAGSAIFVDEQSIFWYLAYLNSHFIRAIAQNLNPSINFQVGDLKKLPVIQFLPTEKTTLDSLAKQCFAIKEWLNGFDPTIYSQDLPEELQKIVSGNSIETSWKSYSNKYQNLSTELVQLENSIDEIVLTAVERQWQLNKPDLKMLTDWIYQVCQPSNQYENPTAASFAKTSLHHLMRHYLKDHAFLSVALSENQNDLALNEGDLNWLSSELNQPLNKYLVEKFSLDQAKQFHGSPQLFCRQLEGNGHAIVFSTQTLRNIGRKKLPMESTTEVNMLNNLAAKMSHVKDWTGKHFLGSTGV